MKLYATYLPGFHQDKYNDKWWGNGFSEWDNVLKSRPLFKGHTQPILPLNGVYDLSDVNTIQKQYSFAKESCIDAFLIYGYWSLGQQPLVQPINNIIENKNINVRFAYFWGNHSWTRSWTNRSGAKDVLLAQQYDDDKDLKNFCNFLCKLFNDPRYETINNRPIFIIYRPTDIPNLEGYLEKFRNFFLTNFHYNPYIIGCITTWQKSYDWIKYFDNMLLFQPSFSLFSTEKIKSNSHKSFFSTIELYLRSLPDSKKKIFYSILDKLPEKHKTYSYRDITEKAIWQNKEFYMTNKKIIPMVCAGFDNTPRYSKRAKILENFSINVFKNALVESKNLAKQQENPIVIVNAWNEWGEGMCIEPDTYYKTQKLDAIKEVFTNEDHYSFELI